MRWNDRVALITGAGSGIGLAITRRFRDEGAQVVAVDVAAAALQRSAATDGIEAVVADVTRRADADRLGTGPAPRIWPASTV